MDGPAVNVTLTGVQSVTAILASTAALVTAIFLGVRAVCRANTEAIQAAVTRAMDMHVANQHQKGTP